MRTGCHYLISLSVRLFVCVSVGVYSIRRLYWLRKLYEANFQIPGTTRKEFATRRRLKKAWDRACDTAFAHIERLLLSASVLNFSRLRASVRSAC